MNLTVQKTAKFIYLSDKPDNAAYLSVIQVISSVIHLHEKCGKGCTFADGK